MRDGEEHKSSTRKESDMKKSVMKEILTSILLKLQQIRVINL